MKDRWLSRALVRRRGALGAALVGAAMLAAACGGTSSTGSTTSSTPFHLQVIGAVSGPLSGVGNAQIQSVRAAVQNLNKSGGINGHKIELSVSDEQSDATKAASVATDVVNQGSKPDMIYMAETAGPVLAMLPIVTRAKILSFSLVGAVAADDPTKYPYDFNLSPISAYHEKAVVTYLQSKNYRKIGFMVGNDASGQAVVAGFNDAVKGTGLNVVQETFQSNGLDFTANLEHLKAQNPDVLVLSANQPAVGYILKNRKLLGWDIPVVGDITVASNDLPKLAGVDALNNVTLIPFAVSKYVAPAQQTPAYKEFIQTTSSLGPMSLGMPTYAGAYDSIILASVAAKQAGKTDPDNMRKALENLKQPNPVPWVTFKHEGFSAQTHFFVPDPKVDYAPVKAGPVVNGVYESPGA